MELQIKDVGLKSKSDVSSFAQANFKSDVISIAFMNVDYNHISEKAESLRLMNFENGVIISLTEESFPLSKKDRAYNWKLFLTTLGKK